MALNIHQMRQIVEWFRTRVGPITCSVCSETDFKFDSELTALPVWRDGPNGGVVDFSDGVPAVMVTCTHCGSVRMFSAAMMGVVSPSARQPQTSLSSAGTKPLGS